MGRVRPVRRRWRADRRIRVVSGRSTLAFSNDWLDSKVEEADDRTVERSRVSASVQNHRKLSGVDPTFEARDVFGLRGSPAGIWEAAFASNCEKARRFIARL